MKNFVIDLDTNKRIYFDKGNEPVVKNGLICLLSTIDNKTYSIKEYKNFEMKTRISFLPYKDYPARIKFYTHDKCEIEVHMNSFGSPIYTHHCFNGKLHGEYKRTDSSNLFYMGEEVEHISTESNEDNIFQYMTLYGSNFLLYEQYKEFMVLQYKDYIEHELNLSIGNYLHE